MRNDAAMTLWELPVPVATVWTRWRRGKHLRVTRGCEGVRGRPRCAEVGILRNWTNRETATCRLAPVFWFADAHSVSELVSGDVESVLAVVVTLEGY